MELYFLDSEFNIIMGPVDSYTSAVWSEKYFEAGTFTIHLPRALVGDIASSVYVRTGYDSDKKCKCGRITYISTSDGCDCELGGVLLEGLLEDVLMRGKSGVGGRLSEVALSSVGSIAESAGIAVDTENSAMLEDEVSLTWDWDRVSDWLYSVLKPCGASFAVELDYITQKPTLRLIKGRDLSESGDSGISRAVFSASYGNIFSVEFEKDSEKMKNYAYIEGSDGTVVTVDKSSGARRREIYKKAADISPAKYDDEDGYISALKRRGEELLSRLPESLYISAECDADALPVYGKDYRLGDICDVSDDELGLCCSLRLTAVDTVAESGEVRRYPVFGETIKLTDRLQA